MTGSGYEHLKYFASEGVAHLSLDRPPANVMNIAMLAEMEAALSQAASDESLKVLVLQAEGHLFSAGVDIADHTLDRVGEMIPRFDRLCVALAEFPCPTVAAVQGHALGGGCELVICCDFAIMAEGARIGQPEVQLAALAPIAALRLPVLVGPRWAARLTFTGEQIESEKAAEIGLVDAVVEAEELPQAVNGFVSRLTGLSAIALRLNKKAFLLGVQGWRTPLEAMERLYLEELMATEDASEGLRAFLEKRKPVWRDR